MDVDVRQYIGVVDNDCTTTWQVIQRLFDAAARVEQVFFEADGDLAAKTGAIAETRGELLGVVVGVDGNIAYALADQSLNYVGNRWFAGYFYQRFWRGFRKPLEACAEARSQNHRAIGCLMITVVVHAGVSRCQVLQDNMFVSLASCNTVNVLLCNIVQSPTVADCRFLLDRSQFDFGDIVSVVIRSEKKFVVGG